MGDVSGESEAFASALQKAHAGDRWGAEALLAEAMASAKREPGAASAEYARACYEYGSLLAAFGQVRRALPPFRDACAVRVAEPSAVKNRLTYLVQLGELLRGVGELDEAEQVLRESLAGRSGFYGEDHAGYAFGLEPLAAVLLHKGRHDEALARVEQAIRVFVDTGHERVATALALRAEVVKVRDPDAPAFPAIEAPASFFGAIAEAVFARAADWGGGDGNAAARRALLQDTHELLCKQLPKDDSLALQALSQIANYEQRLGAAADFERRCSAARELGAAFGRLGQERQAILCVLGLALAQSEAGDAEAALATYRDARERATALGVADLQVKVLRNTGLLLSQMDRRADAEKDLRAATELAERSGEEPELGACRSALGIFLQHGGALEEARTLLQRAVAGLDPANPDALCAQSHLQAIDTKSACGCGDMTDSIAASLERMVQAELPEGLLERLELEITDEDVRISVHLLREPTPEELERLQSAVHRADATLRERIKKGGNVAID